MVFYPRIDELNIAQQLCADTQVIQLRTWLSAYYLGLQTIPAMAPRDGLQGAVGLHERAAPHTWPHIFVVSVIKYKGSSSAGFFP